MYGEDGIPVGVFHVLDRNIPEDASIIDENIDPSIVLDSSVNDLFSILNAVIVGDGCPTSVCNFLHYCVGCLQPMSVEGHSINAIMRYSL